MAAAQATADALDPNNASKKTLKIENVRSTSDLVSTFANLLTDQCPLDRQAGYPHCARKALPATMGSRQGLRGQRSLDPGDPPQFHVCSRFASQTSKVLWYHGISLHEWNSSRWSFFHCQQDRIRCRRRPYARSPNSIPPRIPLHWHAN